MLSVKSLAIWTIVLTCCVSPVFAQGRRGGGGARGGGAGQQQALPPSAYLNARVVEPLQRWEYARLEIVADNAAKDGIAKIDWHAPAEKFEAASLLELVQKLTESDIVSTTAPSEIDDDLVLWNMLGDKGWEYVTTETSAAANQAKRTVIRFKRPKR